MRVAPPAAADDNPGTTDHIKDIFIGRCYDYKQILYKSVLPPVSEDCEGLYKKFTTAFSLMPPCAVTADDYQPFMKAARQTIPKDKAMFWSGVKALAEEYASEGERYVTLEHTLIGYTVDGLVWCGQGAPPGMNFNRCPSWDDCPPEASRAFWASASKVIDQVAFSRDVANVVTHDTCFIDLNTGLRQVFDKHAPLRQRRVQQLRSFPWYSPVEHDLRALKRERRRAERRWASSGLIVHKQIYDMAKQKEFNY
ncbi:hypothetical protein ACOMHN_011564 [Nucella lapillus]